MVCSHNILITINWSLKARQIQRQKQRYGPKFKNKECEPTGREKKVLSDHASPCFRIRTYLVLMLMTMTNLDQGFS